MIPERDGEGNAPVGDGPEDFQGRLLVGLSEKDVAGMDDEVRLFRVQGLFHAPERPFRQGIARDIVRVRELEQFEAAVGPVGQRGGRVGSDRLRAGGILLPDAG